MNISFIRRLEAELSEALCREQACPCCHQQWTMDPSGNSQTLIHDEDCALMELRRMGGKVQVPA